MSIIHYFSKDANKRARFIFNLIAPIYAKVDKTLEANYSKSIALLEEQLTIDGKTVLDVGTGTGAWASMFVKQNAQKVYAIDFSDNMLQVAKQKHPLIHFEKGDAENLIQFKDASFDMVTASYVIHGVKKDKRRTIISEMKRLAKDAIIIHDFVGKTPLFIRFLEFMEQSDYKNFKKNFYDELQEITGWKTLKIAAKDGSGLYIAIKP